MIPDTLVRDIENALAQAEQYCRFEAFEKAKEIYQFILDRHPGHPQALRALHTIAHHSEGFLPSVSTAIVAGSPDGLDDPQNLCPGEWLDESDVLNDRGNALVEEGKLRPAIACFRKALILSPVSAGIHNNLGNALVDLGKLDEAISCFQSALHYKPDYVNAHNNLGVAFSKQGRLEEAVLCYKNAINADVDSALAHNNLGNALRDLGKLDEAVKSFEKSIQIQPNNHEALNNLAVVLAEQGMLAKAVKCYRKSLTVKPDYAPAHSNLIFALNYTPSVTAEQISRESRRWQKIHFRHRWVKVVSPDDPDPERRLRIGYVSPDFRDHSVSYFLEPLLSHHDPGQVEVICYSDVLKPDKVTRRLKKHAHSWVSCIGLSDDAVAERIRHDRIDILIDLAGHTAYNRLGVFARKPAPIQVSWLGYPNTTGLSTIDYRLTDAIADPAGIADRLHSEKLYRLPDAFLCYQPPNAAPKISPLPAMARGFVTFGSFNNLTKMTPDVIDLWAKLLTMIPDSRIIIKNKAMGDSKTRNRCLQQFTRHNIAEDRVDLVSFLPTTKGHLQAYHSIDIALDPFPYNGTTTTCEALWMGVPVVTLAGDRHAARVGASILHCVGLNGLIAQSSEKYIVIAAGLAKDLGALQMLRSSLRSRVKSSPLLDSSSFSSQVEVAFRQMWRERCAYSSSKPPANKPGLESLSVVLERASAFFRNGDIKSAKRLFTTVLRKNPGNPRALHALGVIAFCGGKNEKAISLISKAIEAKPDFVDALNNLGNVYRVMGYFVNAIDCYQAALAINPQFVIALCNLGLIYRNKGWTDKALCCFNQARAIDPNHAEVYTGIASVLAFQGKAHEAVDNYRKVLARNPHDARTHSNLLFMLNYIPTGISEIYDESLRWNDLHGRGCPPLLQPHINSREEDRILRIGYVSSDFRQHSVSYFFEPLVAAHNRRKVEVFCYADVANPDNVTRRLQKLADKWRSTAWADKDELIRLIREDGIDILVDLVGHTAGGTRLQVFAQKPAPIQVTWLGYPNTTGVSAIDYRLTDCTVDPAGNADDLHTEKLVRLPESFLCYRPHPNAPKVVRPPAEDRGFITFGCFNSLAKVRPEVLQLWCRLLTNIPYSMLLIKSTSFADVDTCKLFQLMIEHEGVDPARARLIPSAPTTLEHLAFYGQIDIALDTFPYTGTTTTCEALWMGVPVITLMGDRHASRVCGSILHTVGLEQLIAETPEQYLAIASKLANDLPRLSEIRLNLRKRVSGSPLCDEVRFAQNVEEAYRAMWVTWCRGMQHES